MAMGGSHKGNGNGNRGKPYGLMLLLAFGVALLGVMTLHKLRERRIFNLLVEEKSRQLISLQLLLQKEKEYIKEVKKKAEERKAKIYSLRNQKIELDRRLSEMQSTIDSLKDEQKTMESELEDKQNEIKLLRNKAGNENPQLLALTATLNQKEAEIEDLKRKLESRVRAWSTVSTGNSSNPLANRTVKASMEQKGKTDYKVAVNTTNIHDGNGTTSNFPESGKLQKPESLVVTARNEGANGGMKNESATANTGISGMDGKKNHADAAERIGEKDEQENKNSFSATQLGELNNPRHGGSQKIGEAHTAGKKLEIDDISRLPGKKWRILARNRFQRKNLNSETDGVEIMRSRSFSKEYKDFVRSREGAVSEKGKAETKETESGVNKEARNHTHDADHKQLKVGEAVHTKQNTRSKAKLNSADKDEMEEDTKTVHKHETKTETANGEVSSNFMSHSEEKNV